MRWGPYLAERAWGTVREDYSPDGDAWGYFPHDHARSRAYRWSEDGMAGVCDAEQRLCLALALWNGHDPILKERMFGLSGPQGSHGEDARERWWYADAVPSNAYLKWQYAYPLDGFPYHDGDLLASFEPEPDGVAGSGRWADVTVEYAKASADDIVMRITVENMSVRPAVVHVLPTLWFRNTWSWSPADAGAARRPVLELEDGVLVARHAELGALLLNASAGPDGAPPSPLFCDNETNAARLFGAVNTTAFPKDGINDHVVHGAATVNPAMAGTKAALHYLFHLDGRSSGQVVVRLQAADPAAPAPDTGADAVAVLEARRREADEFHAALLPSGTGDAERAVHRQAVAGLIWSKIFYHYDVDRWLAGDPAQPQPPSSRRSGRNHDWRHLRAHDVVSVPDAWEYPLLAAWDLAFQAVALAHVDPRFAKEQLLTLLGERYLRADGQLPADEWDLGDLTPPVHAWAALRVFEIDGGDDHEFLSRVLGRLMLHLDWLTRRKDCTGRAVLDGGLLGVDGVGPLGGADMPAAGLESSQISAWTAMYCLDLCAISLELARRDAVYEELAGTFAEHFAQLAAGLGRGEVWDDGEGCYDEAVRVVGSHDVERVGAHSVVGLLPLLAVRALSVQQMADVPEFAERLAWLARHKPEYGEALVPGEAGRLLAAVRPKRLARILPRVFDEAQFLAPTGIRSLSKAHRERPVAVRLGERVVSVGYQPGEAGGNVNWRGPVWFPVNVLLIDALRRYGAWATDVPETVEVPTGSGRQLTLAQAAQELSDRLVGTFLPGPNGVPPAMVADWDRMPPAWRERITFSEYFDGDTGAGLGAGHQTGWTGLVIDLLADRARQPDDRKE